MPLRRQIQDAWPLEIPSWNEWKHRRDGVIEYVTRFGEALTAILTQRANKVELDPRATSIREKHVEA
jgi:hypothetical protein